MYIVVYSLEHRGWVVMDTGTNAVISASHDKHEDAVRAIETIAYRIAQGWKP